MRLCQPYRRAGDHIGLELPGGRALFTTRHGGVSRGPFASLNLAIGPSGPGHDVRRHVDENRRRVAGQIGLPWANFRRSRQVHGTTVAGPDGSPPAEADGQVTDQPGTAVLVLVADCLPVALITPGAVGMIHAGWRGLAGGILAEGVRVVTALGAGEPVQAAIGPGVGPCCYEVGPEVHAAFADVPDAHVGRRLDLKRLATVALLAAGVSEVHDVELCTICSDPGLFFSHRREHGVTGRQAGAAWLA